MPRALKRVLLGAVAVLTVACAPAGEPSLTVSAVPSVLDPIGRTARIRVVATNPDGTTGAGAVTLKAYAGTLDATEFELDAYGSANTVLSCPSTDRNCVPGSPVDLTATWTTKKGEIVRATLSVGYGAPTSVWTAASCPEDAKLIYLFTESADLYSFNPPAKALRRLGKLSCPSSGTANSMAVSQDGIGWVNYSDGSLFRINVRTLSCTATDFVAPSGWTRFGMGFSPDSATSPLESLYIASAAGLVQVNVQTMKTTFIGPFGSFASRGAELTGTSEGGLYGFFPPPSPGGAMELSRVSKQDATVTQTKSLSTLTLGASFAYAFSSWGPDFYLYTSSDGAPTTITRYSPAADSVTTHMSAPAGVLVLGAGVSRCGGQ